jgi:hypothetical protein
MYGRKKIRLPVSSLLSLLLLFIPVLIWGLWIYVFQSNPNASQPERVEEFHSYFPGFMRSNFYLSLVVLICCIISIVFAAGSIGKASMRIKTANIITMVVAALIILLQLFSMM